MVPHCPSVDSCADPWSLNPTRLQGVLRERSQRLTEATQTVQDCMQLRRRFPSLSAVAPQGSSLALGFLDVPSQTEFTITVHLSTPQQTAMHELRA